MGGEHAWSHEHFGTTYKRSVEQNLSALAKQHRLHCSRDVTASALQQTQSFPPWSYTEFHPGQRFCPFPPFQSQLLSSTDLH